MPTNTDLLPDLLPSLESAASAPRWCVALSGGLDSTVLLDLLVRYAADYHAPPILALHVDHGLQEESGAWAEHCREVCSGLGVGYSSHRVKVDMTGSGPEAAARSARYAVFEGELAEGECLFMAHHLDDQVETFFLRLMRGAGVDGLAGIPGHRSLGKGRLLRPLLGVSRQQMHAYALERGLNWIEDPSNDSPEFDRNFLRQRVLPLLAERWPAYRGNVDRSMSLLQEAGELLREGAGEALEIESVCGDFGLQLQSLLQGSDAEIGLRLRRWLAGRELPMPGASQLREFLRQLQTAAEDTGPVLDCGSYRLGGYRNGLYLLPDEISAPTEPVEIKPGQSVDLPGVGVLALERGEGPGLRLMDGQRLTVRWRRGGERCRPLGRGSSLSLKKLLQEAGVPPWWRDRLPLLYLGEDLLAVADLCLCQSAAAGPEEGGWRLSLQRNCDPVV